MLMIQKPHAYWQYVVPCKPPKQNGLIVALSYLKPLGGGRYPTQHTVVVSL
jgi:hypothetical protein